MLKSFMRVKITIIFIYFFVLSGLSANEPLLARLESTISNEKQIFGIGTYTFTCKPYGVFSLEELYKTSPQNSECRRSIERLYKKNLQLQYFAEGIFKYKQLYHIEIKDKSCVVYAKGEISLSELLLKNGLAIHKLNFRDEEFKSYFSKAQQAARVKKIGLWKEKVFENCMKELSED